jgi:hypothetical protein
LRSSPPPWTWAFADNLHPSIRAALDERRRSGGVLARACLALRAPALDHSVALSEDLRDGPIEILLKLARTGFTPGSQVSSSRLELRARPGPGGVDAGPRSLILGQQPRDVRIHGSRLLQ